LSGDSRRLFAMFLAPHVLRTFASTFWHFLKHIAPIHDMTSDIPTFGSKLT
jgi:hypothetical protein